MINTFDTSSSLLIQLILYFYISLISFRMQTVDVRGQKCPVPIIETKKALGKTEAGGSFKVLTDRQPSFNNLTRFLQDNRIQFSSAESDGVWTLTITKNT